MPPHATSAAADKAAWIAEACQQAKATKTGWMACCPAHDDAHPSLSIDYTDDRVLLICRSQHCPVDAICSALGISVADLFCGEKKGKHAIVATYDYTDENGTLLFQACRLSNKSFFQRQPSGGGWEDNIQGVRRVLYHLPEVLAAVARGESIYIAEGEKDVDNLRTIGLTATCNPMGAEKWTDPGYNQMLAGADCYLLPDHDTPGAKHMQDVAKKIAPHARSVRIVDGIHTEATKSDVSDWLNAGGTRAELEALASTTLLWTPPGREDSAASDAAPGTPVPKVPTWTDQLLLSAKKIPLENISNLLLILENHEHWTDRFWFDAVRAQPMLDDIPIDDHHLVEIARWFGLTIGMPLYYLRRLENCVRAVCQKKPRDLLAEWLLALPPWDQVPRLTEWLTDVASITKDDYGMELSRLIPVSMVARALKPGCQYRYVIIFEGAEDSGKSKLVRTLASPTWYREFAVSMDNKEAHMLLQGAWVAELGELASLSRTEEARLKSFVTLEEDVWIPKYSNFPQHAPRRTIFLGTVNPEDEYLRGQTGNTRFLPIKTGVIECADLEVIREQLFAEALVYYKDHPDTWWQLSEDAECEAQKQREERRQSSVFEEDLANWLDKRRHDPDHPVKDGEGKLVDLTPGETSWEEIAQYYLRIDREKWKDKILQSQIAQALRAKGWTKGRRQTGGHRARYWYKRVAPPL